MVSYKTFGKCETPEGAASVPNSRRIDLRGLSNITTPLMVTNESQGNIIVICLRTYPSPRVPVIRTTVFSSFNARVILPSKLTIDPTVGDSKKAAGMLRPGGS